jgi:hypothetical protein
MKGHTQLSWEQEETLRALPLDPEMPWFLMRGGRREGPLTLRELRNLLTSGQVAADTLLWQQGLLQWTPTYLLPQLRLLCDSLPPDEPGMGEDAITLVDFRESLANIANQYEAVHHAREDVNRAASWVGLGPFPPEIPPLIFPSWKDRLRPHAQRLQQAPRWMWAAGGAVLATLVQLVVRG